MAPLGKLPTSAGALVVLKLAHSLYRRLSAEPPRAPAGPPRLEPAPAPPVAAGPVSDADASAAEVEALRDELARELERVASQRREPPAEAA